MADYEPLYIDYLIYFNRDQDYFECHEVLEELWLECDRDPLYKGLRRLRWDSIITETVIIAEVS